MRPHKHWYHPSRDTWFRGDQRQAVPPLAKGEDDEEEAMQAFYRLMASGAGKLPDADALHVAIVCDRFLDGSQNHHAPDTYRGYKDFLQDFGEVYSTLLGNDLKPLHVTRWLDAHLAGRAAAATRSSPSSGLSTGPTARACYSPTRSRP